MLLDLGGVVVELSGVDEFGAMVGAGDAASVWRTWLCSPAVRRFERGLCDVDTFAEEIVAELRLRVSPDYFRARFATWPGQLYPGAHALVARLRAALPVGCLSNTNDLHWQGRMRELGLHGAFDHYFLSHRIGMLKPDEDIFRHVLDVLGVAPAELLFLDDNQLNVDGARALGIDAHLAQGLDQARALLIARGLLDPLAE